MRTVSSNEETEGATKTLGRAPYLENGEGKRKEAVTLDQRSSAGIGPWARPPVRPGWTNGPLGAPGEKNSPGETMPPRLGVVKLRERSRGCERYPVPRLCPRAATNAFTATMLLYASAIISLIVSGDLGIGCATFDVIRNLWKALVRTIEVSRWLLYRCTLIRPQWKTDDVFKTAEESSNTMHDQHFYGS